MITILLSILSLGGMAVLFGLGLGYAGVKFQVDEDPRLAPVREALPGANCGGCGFAGCDALAAAIVEGKASPNDCPVGGNASAKAIAEVMGIKVETREQQVSFIRCNGGESKSNFRYDYSGLKSCGAAMQLAAGGCKSCRFGCLGEGSCLQVCKFDAITIVDGIAQVDKNKCTGCGMCVGVCPKSIIQMVPQKSTVKVACCSGDDGKTVRANCTIGCIACKLCEKACKFGAIHVENNLARIDYDKCTMCEECVKKCPTKVIQMNA